jgi:hypothetical protein
MIFCFLEAKCNLVSALKMGINRHTQKSEMLIYTGF